MAWYQSIGSVCAFNKLANTRELIIWQTEDEEAVVQAEAEPNTPMPTETTPDDEEVPRNGVIKGRKLTLTCALLHPVPVHHAIPARTRPRR